MATTDNAADVKKICNSAVNLIDDNPLGVDFASFLSTQKGAEVWARKPTSRAYQNCERMKFASAIRSE
ncbi:hypothetical protein [Desulfuromonas acetoxidans]|uniref:hypothetical protein n=1 Tax=Desulfuromonas acetoxidans TaxID=891 RepID=UPI00292D709C|nr:hypothetical protein [Desulfuromonas acetoxidans]